MKYSAKVNEILGLLLKTIFPDNENVLKSEYATWDSLKHIELIFILEDEFDIRITEEQMVKLESTSTISDLIEQYDS